MIVFDTNVISELLKPQPDPAVLDFVHGMREPAAITAIALGELSAGAARLPDGRRKDTLVQAISSTVAAYSKLVPTM